MLNRLEVKLPDIAAMLYPRAIHSVECAVWIWCPSE